MKISRKIVEQMPSRTPRELKAKEAAQKTLLETESYVDSCEDSFLKTMDLDERHIDQNPTHGAVSVTNQTSRYTSVEELGSRSASSDVYSRTVRTGAFPMKGQYRTQTVEEQSMQVNKRRGRAVFQTRTGQGVSMRPDIFFGAIETDNVKKYVSVKGEGADRVFRLGEPGKLRRLWEGAADLASSAIGLIAPLRAALPGAE